jgi:hypothetical protein
VLDVVSAAILGGVAAENDRDHLPAVDLATNIAETMYLNLLQKSAQGCPAR